MSATLSLIDITGVAGVARSGHYCSRANKSATPLNIKLNSTQLNSTENYGRRYLTPLSPHRNYILS